MATAKHTTIDAYIADFPKDVQKVLEQVRNTIKEAASDVEEKISYAIPAFALNSTNLVYFAGYKNHVGLYPAPTGNPLFEKDFAGYKTGKGSIQFPLDKPMPLHLITKIVQFRMKEILPKKNEKNKAVK
ncbi:MAG: DUF1801 domain-containing protein [Segetibacter sp.]